MKSLDADKAQDIITINLDDPSTSSALGDYMVIASGTSSRHVSALADRIKKHLDARGIKGVSIEGLNSCDWVIMDAGDVIVHLFRPEVREFYNIEKMWCAYQSFDVVGGSEGLSA